MSEIQYITWDELLHVYEKTADKTMVRCRQEYVDACWKKVLDMGKGVMYGE